MSASNPKLTFEQVASTGLGMSACGAQRTSVGHRPRNKSLRLYLTQAPGSQVVLDRLIVWPKAMLDWLHLGLNCPMELV
jgi:hypothetical protein